MNNRCMGAGINARRFACTKLQELLIGNVGGGGLPPNRLMLQETLRRGWTNYVRTLKFCCHEHHETTFVGSLVKSEASRVCLRSRCCDERAPPPRSSPPRVRGTRVMTWYIQGALKLQTKNNGSPPTGLLYVRGIHHTPWDVC